MYDIRVLNDSDVDEILGLYRKNPLFYEYTEARPTREQVSVEGIPGPLCILGS